MRTYRKSLNKPLGFSPKETAMTRFFLMLLIHGPFFGIPQTYLAHIKTASEFRGHLAGLRQSWESYTKQLVREYSDFILIVSRVVLLFLDNVLIFMQATVLLS